VPAVHGRPEAGGSRLTASAQRVAGGAGAPGPAFGAALLVVVCLLAGVAPASAQKDSVITVGGAFSLYHSTDDQVESPWGVGIVARLRRNSGFGGTIGFNWIKAGLNGEVDGEKTRLGTLLVRPLMLGVVYTRQYGHFALSGSLLAGYAFNGLRKMQGGGANFAVSDSWVYKPSVAIWWELGNRWGFLSSVSYMATRPELVTTTAAGTTRQKINFGAPFVTFGLGYGVF
jgi:hypothetical protein